MKIFRLSGFIAALVISVLLWLLLSLFVNGWIKSGVEHYGTAANGASVSADSTQVKWFDSALSIQSLELADPEDLMRNRLQLDDLTFDLSVPALLKGQFHVDELSITGVALNSPRQNPAERVTEIKGQGAMQWPSIANQVENINAEALLAKVDIKSPQKYREFEQKLVETQAHWKSEQQALPSKDDLQKHKAAYAAAKAKLEQASGIDKLSAAKELKAVLKAAKRDQQKLSDFQQSISNDLKQSKQAWKELQQQVSHDAELALSMASLSPEGMRHLAASFLGENSAHWIELVFNNLDALNSIPSHSEEPQKAPLRRGYDHFYSKLKKRPDFWIGKTQLGGQLSFEKLKGDIKGNFHHLANERVAGEPMTMEVSMSLPADAGNASSTGFFNMQVAHPDDQKFPVQGKLELNQWPFEQWALGSSGLALERGVMTSALSWQANKSTQKVLLKAKLFGFERKQSEQLSSTEQHLAQIIDSAKEITLSVTVERVEGKSQIKIKSNLDELLFAKIKGEVKQQANAAKQQIIQSIDAQVAPVKQQVEQRLSELVSFDKSISDKINELSALK